MGKGKKGKKGKKEAEPTEPAHDPGWERAVASGRWDRPPDALPDASQWPTWGALRERILTSCKEIIVTWSTTLRDTFPAELVKLSPPELSRLELRGCPSLSRFVLSPVAACPKLVHLDLSSCNSLVHVLIQSVSLETLALSRCTALHKALVQCKNLRQLNMEGCDNLDVLMVWSEILMELDLTTCTMLRSVELYCPELYGDNCHLPKLRVIPPPEPPKHPPIVQMLKEQYSEKARKEAEQKEREHTLSASNTVFPRTFRKV